VFPGKGRGSRWNNADAMSPADISALLYMHRAIRMHAALTSLLARNSFREEEAFRVSTTEISRARSLEWPSGATSN